jgi:hypothetical protein
MPNDLADGRIVLVSKKSAKTLALELAQHRINVNVVSPGPGRGW